MNTTIIVDRERCQGYANCLVNAPDIFDIDDDGKVIVLEEHPAADAIGEYGEAVESCPVRALSLSELP